MKLDWQLRGHWVSGLEGEDGRALALVISGVGVEYFCVAIETTMAAVKADGLEGVLSDHSHDVVAQSPSLEQVQAAAASYAENWEKRRRLPACGCEDIKP